MKSASAPQARTRVDFDESVHHAKGRMSPPNRRLALSGNTRRAIQFALLFRHLLGTTVATTLHKQHESFVLVTLAYQHIVHSGLGLIETLLHLHEDIP